MKTIGFVVTAALALSAGAGAQADAPQGFKVIVNTSVPGQKVPRTVLAQIYLGSAQRWGDGRPIIPVDLSSTSPVRHAFSAAVLEMPIDRVKMHWLRTVTTGKRPPLTRNSDEDVIAFVASEKGGIGYVSETAAVPATVHVVTVE